MDLKKPLAKWNSMTVECLQNEIKVMGNGDSKPWLNNATGE